MRKLLSLAYLLGMALSDLVLFLWKCLWFIPGEILDPENDGLLPWSYHGVKAKMIIGMTAFMAWAPGILIAIFGTFQTVREISLLIIVEIFLPLMLSLFIPLLAWGIISLCRAVVKYFHHINEKNPYQEF